MPFFSVIIPTYNREKLLGLTIESILAQDDQDFEIIVVDDGSTDGTIALLERYAGRVILLQQKQQGPGAARNLGAADACGNYVAFLDSDDLWFPWTLANYRQAIIANNRPAFVAGTPFRFSDEKAVTGVSRFPLQTDTFRDYFASGDRWRWFGASSFVVRRDVFLHVQGFCREWIHGEDADLAMKLGDSAGFVHVTAPHSFAYRDHPNTAISNLSRNAMGLNHMIESERRGLYPGGDAHRKERLRIITRHARPASFEFLAKGLFGLGWQIYGQTFRWQCRLGRVRYILAFPTRFIARYLRR